MPSVKTAQRLQAALQKAPMRGIGAGLPENQRQVGAEDPEAAAALAAMAPEEMQEAMDRFEAENARIDGLRERLLIAAASGRWVPPRKEGDKRTAEQYIQSLPPGLVESLAGNLPVEEAMEEPGEAANDPFRIEPDHPSYEPMMDVSRRKSVEQNLKALDFETLIFKGYAEQEVPLRPGFPITFRTISTQHGLWLEQRLGEVGKEVEAYGRHWFSLQQVAAGVHQLGKKPIGVDLAIVEDRKEFYEEIDRRMKALGKLPKELTDDLITQYIWFSGRVRKLLQGNLLERVGN